MCEKKIDISIIVPIYNEEKCLIRCIESILTQNLENWELILVDDGSIDNSRKICDAYSYKDTRIKVIYKENEGVSVARNVGISVAKGTYIGFVDADDWIKPTMYKVLLAVAVHFKPDIVMCDVTTVFSDKKKSLDTIRQLSESMKLSKGDISPSLLVELAGSTCRCIYKRELIEKHGIKFPKDIAFSEDCIFNLFCFGYAKNVYYLKQPFYYRFVNINSTVHRFHDDYFIKLKKATEAIDQVLRLLWNDDLNYIKYFQKKFVGATFGAINNYYYRTSTFNARERIQILRKICDDEHLRKAIVAAKINDPRGKLILNRQVILLAICAKLVNWKNRR